MYLSSHKLNVIIDGQFGSTGKGLLASYIAAINHIDIVISNASANAGHTFWYHNKKYITKHIPVSAIIHPRCQIYLCAGAIINPSILLDEMDRFDISPDRICVHPRCAIIEEADIVNEASTSSSATHIASTQSGVGQALIRKIARSACLASDTPKLAHIVNDFNLQYYLDIGCTALMEVPQGFDLSISSGFSYPYCTSREITVSAALSDAQVHPAYLGKVAVCIRTFPIRVGHIVKDGIKIGDSGPFYDDSVETSWRALGLEEEYTTVTGRVRRVASFSMKQYHKMISSLRPDYVLLNFANYLDRYSLSNLLDKLPEVTHLGFGPKIKDVYLNHGYL